MDGLVLRDRLAVQLRHRPEALGDGQRDVQVEALAVALEEAADARRRGARHGARRVHAAAGAAVVSWERWQRGGAEGASRLRGDGLCVCGEEQGFVAAVVLLVRLDGPNDNAGSCFSYVGRSPSQRRGRARDGIPTTVRDSDRLCLIHDQLLLVNLQVLEQDPGGLFRQPNPLLSSLRYPYRGLVAQDITPQTLEWQIGVERSHCSGDAALALHARCNLGCSCGGFGSQTELDRFGEILDVEFLVRNRFGACAGSGHHVSPEWLTGALLDCVAS